MKTSVNPLPHKSNENTCKITKIHFSGLWKLTKGIQQINKHLLKKNQWTSVRKAKSVVFHLVWCNPPDLWPQTAGSPTLWSISSENWQSHSNLNSWPILELHQKLHPQVAITIWRNLELSSKKERILYGNSNPYEAIKSTNKDNMQVNVNTAGLALDWGLGTQFLERPYVVKTICLRHWTPVLLGV